MKSGSFFMFGRQKSYILVKRTLAAVGTDVPRDPQEDLPAEKRRTNIVSGKIIKNGMCGTCGWTIDDDYTLRIRPADGRSGILEDRNEDTEESLDDASVYWPWNYANDNEKIRKVVIEKGVRADAHLHGIFSNFRNCTEFDIENLDTGLTTDFSSVFESCRSVRTMPAISKWDMGKAESLAAMFKDCPALTDISPVADINARGIKSIESLFEGCGSLADISPLAKLDTGNVRNMAAVLKDCVSVTSLSSLAEWNTGKTVWMQRAFRGCSMESLAGLEGWDVSSTISFTDTFAGCPFLKDVSGAGNWDMGKPVFLDTESTGRIPAMRDMRGMYRGCTALESLAGLEGLKTSGAERMDSLFEGCISLKDIKAAAGWEFGNVTSLSRAFSGCVSLKDISPLAHIDTGKVMNMSYMFGGCVSITDVSPLAGLKISRAAGMTDIFHGCSGRLDTSMLDGWKSERYIRKDQAFGESAFLTGGISFTGSPADTDRIRETASGMGTGKIPDFSGLGKWEPDGIRKPERPKITPKDELDLEMLGKMVTETKTDWAELDSRLVSWEPGKAPKVEGMFDYSNDVFDIPRIGPFGEDREWGYIAKAEYSYADKSIRLISPVPNLAAKTIEDLFGDTVRISAFSASTPEGTVLPAEAVDHVLRYARAESRLMDSMGLNGRITDIDVHRASLSEKKEARSNIRSASLESAGDLRLQVPTEEEIAEVKKLAGDRNIKNIYAVIPEGQEKRFEAMLEAMGSETVRLIWHGTAVRPSADSSAKERRNDGKNAQGDENR